MFPQLAFNSWQQAGSMTYGGGWRYLHLTQNSTGSPYPEESLLLMTQFIKLVKLLIDVNSPCW